MIMFQRIHPFGKILSNSRLRRGYQSTKTIPALTKLIAVVGECVALMAYKQIFYKQRACGVNLDQDRYPIKRGEFGTITDADVAHFGTILSPTRCLTDTIDLQLNNIDFMAAVRGHSQLLLKPRTTEEVSAILRYCNSRKLAVCPQGGNTGLVGGSVPVFDEIILSTQLMNEIDLIDAMSGVLVCQAGCVLEHLEECVAEHGLVMPIDLGAKGSCHIGGNVSTNAGGLRLLRYGNLHGNVLGLEAVRADGTVLNLLSTFKKDNTGYHLKNLFIGSEGTLGVITKVAIACPTASRAINVAFIGLDSYDSVMQTFLAAKRDLGEILSSCEMIDQLALRCSVDTYNLTSPIAEYPFYMLIETSGSRVEHDEEKINDFLTAAMERGHILDGTVTNDKTKINQIWQLREFIPTGMFKDGYCFKYDISLPLSHFYEIVPAMRAQVGDLATRVCGYGHIGDANLHLNVSCDAFTEEIYRRVEPFVYEYTSKLRGSVSAEHGIGFLKTKYLKYSKEPEALTLMRQMKTLMDPNEILNPYKVLPGYL